jgi:hypothetical protein
MHNNCNLKWLVKSLSLQTILDSLGIILESIIQFVTDKMILNIGHSFKLMKILCILWG